jgi:hypothetical protein
MKPEPHHLLFIDIQMELLQPYGEIPGLKARRPLSPKRKRLLAPHEIEYHSSLGSL